MGRGGLEYGYYHWPSSYCVIFIFRLILDVTCSSLKRASFTPHFTITVLLNFKKSRPAPTGVAHGITVQLSLLMLEAHTPNTSQSQTLITKPLIQVKHIEYGTDVSDYKSERRAV